MDHLVPRVCVDVLSVLSVLGSPSCGCVCDCVCACT